MGNRNVAVTGVGMIGSLGATAGEFAGTWMKGGCARRAGIPELAGTPMSEDTAAVLPEFDPVSRLGGRRMLKYMSDAAVLGCIAAKEALGESGVQARFQPERIGIYAGTGLAAASVSDVQAMVEQSIDAEGGFSCGLLGARGLPATNPLLSFKILANMPPCLISVSENIKGPNLIFTPWEGQTASAIEEGWRAVASGEVDCALVGAADTSAYPSTFVYLRQSGWLGRDEYPASGAGYIVLESEESARKAKAGKYCIIAGIDIRAGRPVCDPLAQRAGRSFAAAPALLLGLACRCAMTELSICGADRQEFTVKLEAAR